MARCRVRDEFVKRLADLARKHFELTVTITENHPLSVQERIACAELRRAWERVREEMVQHCALHGCFPPPANSPQ